MVKPQRRRVYLFMTRPDGEAGQVLIFSHADPGLWGGVQTPGGTIEPDEHPAEAALREAREETGLRHFGEPLLLAEDHFENPDETLLRYFFHLPVLEKTEDIWTHQVQGEGVDGGVPFTLRWANLPDAEDLDPHFRAYMDRVRITSP